MASRYPNQFDDTTNIPTVKEGLTEITGSMFNRLRDGLFAIERTLGLVPQGSFPDLVSRLAVAINTDGSLNKTALQMAGFVYGPITDADIDPNAAISESKLHLNYPTSVLQNSIATLDARNAGLIDLITTAQAQIQQHITRAIGAHRATAIATDTQASPVSSSSAVVKIESNNVQLVLQDLFARHINFNPGANSNLLSLTNSPHQANQIFYDNTNTELPTNSVQGAIDNLYVKGDSFITDHQRQLHSNGIQRRIEAFDAENATGIARGRIILSSFTATLQYPNSNANTSAFLNIPIQQGASVVGISLISTNADGSTELIPLDVDDSLQMTDPLGTIYSLLPITDLKVNNITDTTTNITTPYLAGVEVFYNPDIFAKLFNANGITDTNPLLQLTCSVFKKVDVQGNENGLNCIARVLRPNSIAEPDLSSSVSEIQIAHPNAATIISQGFNPSALGRRSDGYFDRNFTSTLNLVVDDISYVVQIVPNSPVDITLDTCVAKANLGFLQQNIPAAAYILGEEMVIAHNLPDDVFSSSTNRHTLRIVSGGGVDASSAAGFSYIANTTVYGSSGNSFIVNGVQRSTFRVKIPFQGTEALSKGGFTIFGNVIVFNDAANNPLIAGVRVGDLVNLQGLTSPSVLTNLNGSRRISNLTSNTITVDGDPFPVDVVVGDSATLVIYANIVSLDGLAQRFQSDFAGLDPNLSQNIIVQLFMNSAGETDYHERLIYPNAATVSGTPYGGPPILPITNLTTDDHGIYIVDCSRGLQGSPEGVMRIVSLQFDNNKRVFATFGCQSSPNDGYTISSSLHGAPVNITGDGFYTLIDETGLEFITLQSVKAFNLLSDTILNTIPDGSLLAYTLPIVKFEEVNEFENLLLANVYYNSQVNQIPLLNGSLAVFDKRYSGTLGAEQLRDDVIEKYISGPFGETRGDGVVLGLIVPSDPTATQNITNDKVVYVNGGVVYVQGVRYEITSQQIYVDPATLDISQYGTDGYFPGTGAGGDGSFKNGYIRYYVFVDHNGRLQTTSTLNLPASLPFVPLAKVVLTTHGLLNNSPNIISVNVVDFRRFISRIDDMMEITVASIPQQPAHFHSIIAATEYIDNMRYNDVITGSNVHIRPTVIRVREGVYQEATTIELPPNVSIIGDSAHSVRIRPPVNLLGRQITNSNLSIDDTANNQFVININALPEGTSAKVENVCFDLNTSTTSGSLPVPGAGKVGGIKITWFDNTSAAINIPPQLATTSSVVDIKDCIFVLDGPAKSTGIQTVFSSSTPLITGGLINFSYSYSLLYNKIYFGDYYQYKAIPFLPPISAPPIFPTIGPFHLVPTPSFEPGPPIGSGDGYLQTNPTAPNSPEDAIFTDPNAPINFNHGGIMNISNNVFVITNGFGSIGIDRFYDTTVGAGYNSPTPVAVSNTRMKAFKVVSNSFQYNGSLLNQSYISPALNGIIPPTTPANTSAGTAGQEALRNQIYDLMIHKDLRGVNPSQYSNGRTYPDPQDGYGIPDGYNVPASGGKVSEFMVISANTPTGLNIPEASPIRFATETQDSIARDNHGGGTVFATITIPPSGLPIIIDRSLDWHDRYIMGYGNNFFTDPAPSSVGKNRLYTGPTPIQNINGGISFIPTAANMINGSIGGNNAIFNLQGISVDRAMTDYGATSAASHGWIFGYSARLSGDLVSIRHPAAAQFPGWSSVKYLGTFSFTSDLKNNIALVVMPNGDLAALNAGTQDPTGVNTSSKLVQTSDSFPAPSDPSRASTSSITIALVIQYSPKVNVLTTSQIDANSGINTLDNWGGGYGKI